MRRSPALLAASLIGCGAQSPVPARVEVPERDATPPEPVIRAAGAEAGRGDPWPRIVLPRGTRSLSATAVGRDPDGGMGRARVSFEASFLCRERGSGRGFAVPVTQHVPPPAIARVKVAPGVVTATHLTRTATLSLDGRRCRGGRLEAARGEVWADTTNASGLDATSSHIRFRTAAVPTTTPRAAG